MRCEIVANAPNAMRPFSQTHAAVAFDRLLSSWLGCLANRILSRETKHNNKRAHLVIFPQKIDEYRVITEMFKVNTYIIVV